MSQGRAFNEWFAAQQSEASQLASAEAGQGSINGTSATPSKPFWQFWKPAAPQPPPQEEESQSLLPSFLRRGTPKPEPSPIPSLSRSDRMKGFLAFMGLSALFFALAFFIGLPMVLLAPSKFALSFTLGSLCFMTGFALLEGPAAYLKHLCTRDRLPFTLLYIGSMGLTLYSALVLQSYFAVVGSACLQLAALAWYGATYIPGGTSGMKFISHMALSAVKAGLKPCFKMLR